MRKPVAISITVIIIVVLLIGLFAWWYAAAQKAAAPAPSNTEQSTTETPPSDDVAEAPNEGITIVFTNSGFEDSSYMVKAGQTVTVKNDSSMEVEFSSDEHPTHTDNPELNMEDLQPGETQTFTPENAGTWGIHDHRHAQYTTTLIVTE